MTLAIGIDTAIKRRCAACNDEHEELRGRVLLDYWHEDTGRDVCGPCAHCPPEVLSYEDLQAAIVVPGDGLTASQRVARDAYWRVRMGGGE